MLALKRYGAFLMWCIVATGIYVTTVLVVNAVVESGNIWLHPPLAACIYFAVTVVQRWVRPRITAFWKHPRVELAPPSPSISPACADEIHQPSLSEGEKWLALVKELSGDDYKRLAAEGGYTPRHLHGQPVRRHVAPPGSIPEQRSNPPK